MYKANTRSAFHRAIASKEAFAVASIELFSRLWVELDTLLATDGHGHSAGITPGPRVQVLRLELILLLDACQSTRWRAQLDTIQRLSLQSIFDDILHMLNTSSEEEILRGPIESAQNHLLDAIQRRLSDIGFSVE
jgi:hypothetical protein